MVVPSCATRTITTTMVMLVNGGRGVDNGDGAIEYDYENHDSHDIKMIKLVIMAMMVMILVLTITTMMMMLEMKMVVIMIIVIKRTQFFLRTMDNPL